MKRLAIAVVSMALAVACASSTPDDAATTSPSTGAGPRDLVIAVGGPFSGDDKAIGDQIRAGAKLAADQVNAGGGIAAGPLKGSKLVIDDGFDDANVPQRAVDNMRRAVDDEKYVAFVGSGLSDASLAAAPVASQAGLSYMTVLASSPKILEAATAQKCVFVVPPTYPAYSFSVADELVQQGFRRPALLHATGTYGDGIAGFFVQRLKEKGIEPVAEETFQSGDAGFTEQLGRIRAGGADSLVMVGLATDDAVIVRQAERLGLDVAVFDPGGVTYSEVFLADAGPTATGVVGSTPTDALRNTPAAVALRLAYTAATGESVVPDPAVFAYEGVLAVATGFADGASTRLDLSDHIHVISIADTGVGPLRFGPDGSRLGGRLYIFQIVAGVPVFTTGYEQTGPLSVEEIQLER